MQTVRSNAAYVGIAQRVHRRTYKPNPVPLAIGKACCDTVNRGGAYAKGKLIHHLLDNHTVAVDVKTASKSGGLRGATWRTAKP
jgi:hypothetical protein